MEFLITASVDEIRRGEWEVWNDQNILIKLFRRIYAKISNYVNESVHEAVIKTCRICFLQSLKAFLYDVYSPSISASIKSKYSTHFRFANRTLESGLSPFFLFLNAECVQKDFKLVRKASSLLFHICDLNRIVFLFGRKSMENYTAGDGGGGGSGSWGYTHFLSLRCCLFFLNAFLTRNKRNAARSI